MSMKITNNKPLTKLRPILSLAWVFVLLLSVVVQAQSTVFALTGAQRKVLNSGVYYFNTEASAANCGGASLLPGSTNDEKIWNFFISKGLTAFQTAGIMGNMKAESHMEPRLVQYGKLNTRGEVSKPGEPSSLDDTPPTGSDTGYGLVQFTPGTKILPAATRLNMPPGDLNFQLTLIWEQLNGESEIPEKKAGDHLKATTTLEDASRSFEYKYERHAVNPDQEGIRIGFANEFMVQFGGGVVVSGGSSSSNSGCSLSSSGCPDTPITQDQTVVVQGITVHPCISAELNRILTLAKSQGFDMSGGGYRDSAGQINTRRKNCGTSDYDIYEKPVNQCKPPTAIPGLSNHEKGTAIDFTCDGVAIGSQSDPCFIFLEENTSLVNLESEPWHWSHNGN